VSRSGEGPRRAIEESPKKKARKEKPERSPLQVTLLWFGEFMVYVVIMLVVMSLIRAFLVQPYIVPTGSMQQTIELDDTIVAWKPGEVQRGDIVVFRDDLGWLGPAQPVPWWKNVLAFVGVAPPYDEQYLVKRLIGLPGDRVTCCDTKGRIIVNGQPLDEESYLYEMSPGVPVAPSALKFDIIVPEGRIFVMGDHRNGSADSREHMCRGTEATPEVAFPELSAIQGEVFAIIRPLARLQRFHIPDTFAAVPSAAQDPPPVDKIQWRCGE
jgi:signal peptidase I